MDDDGSSVRPGDDVTTKGRRGEGDDPQDASTQKEPEGEKPREIYAVRGAGETMGAVRGAAVDDPGSGFVTV